MSANEASNSEANTKKAKLSVGGRVLRYLFGIVVSVGAAIGACHGIVSWQEWRWKQEALALVQPTFTADNPPSAKNFSPRQVVSPFPPITEFPVVSFEEADKEIDDTEFVLGVVVNNKARAYPINMLTGPSREILNDSLGGQTIAATW